ncbi:phosphoribosylanthranilate isomerase [Kitasatospora sp. NPDC006697]|uniref:phosphoribosylanthranilate isomerase n=1 Tax=Kitasatospora sp. NPDC006697 TaxID=3364020 RepID=UPI0036B7CFF8
MFVKVCGLRTAEDVAAAVAAGADAVGFLLSDSPRRVSVEQARRLAAEVPLEVLTVAVYQEEPAEQVRAEVRAAGMRAVQLHGAHPPRAFAELGDLGVTLVRATAAATAGSAECGEFGEDLLILDSPRPGSGEAWDWSALRGRRSGRWLLAGGLNPGNVAQAVAGADPWGVDVSSGVEISRGVKDPELIAEFVRLAKAAG